MDDLVFDLSAGERKTFFSETSRSFMGFTPFPIQ